MTVKWLASALSVWRPRRRGVARSTAASYERIVLIAADFEQGSLSHTPPVEDEPDAATEDIIAVLADAEKIVDDVEASVIEDLDRQQGKQPWWRRRRRGGGDDGDDFRLSNR